MDGEHAVFALGFDPAGVDRFVDREGSVEVPLFVLLKHKILFTMTRLDAPVQNQFTIFVAELHTSRRYAQALLEALDAERVTLRVGDERVLRRRKAGYDETSTSSRE